MRELEVQVEVDPAGAVPPPIPPVAPPPLPAAPTAGPGLFQRPALEEVAAYFAALPDISAEAATTEASRFFNYYQANGWRVGRHRMADSPAAARNWLINADRFKAAAAGIQASAATRLHSGGNKNYHEPL